MPASSNVERPRRLSRVPGLASSLFLVVLSSSPALTQPLPAEARGKAFWLALARDCAVPAGASASGLVGEAVSFLGSPDTEWRDDVAYGVVASCVHEKKLLSAEERRELVRRLSGNLRQGIGSTGTDTVLLRSFSALDLSVLAALENSDPALDAAGYRRLLDDALAYLRDERDLRGLEPRVGWIHATAHTADLLKFLARDPRFTPADQQRLLDAVWAKATATGTPVFTHAEDERLAAALVSEMRRPDFDTALLDPWLARFVFLEKQVWLKAPPDPPTLDASQNARNLLRCLYVLLSQAAPATAGQEEAASGASGAGGAAAAGGTAARATASRERVLVTLGAIRR